MLNGIRDLRPALVLSILASSACAAAGQDAIRKGHSAPEVRDEIVSGEINRWVLRTGAVGEKPMMIHVSSEAVRTGYYNDFRSQVELEIAEGRRELVKKNLEDRYFDNVRLTSRGVSYQVENNTDDQLRSLVERGASDISYEPHDCTRVIGKCAYTVSGGGKPVRHYIRTSAFNDGIWTDRITFDPDRDPDGRSDLVEERRFSVASTGVTIDMQRTQYRDGRVYQTVLQHVGRVVPEVDERPKVASQELPQGSYVGIGSTCEDGEVELIVGQSRQALGLGQRIVVANARDAAAKLSCKESNGKSTVGTTCSKAGHIRAWNMKGATALGCYEGPAPANPWAGS